MSEINLSNHVALVTGAAAGIGYEIALQMALAGCRVGLLDVRLEVVESAAAGLRAQGFEALGLTADVSRKEQVTAAVQKLVEQWGTIHILVNNAGICPTTPFTEISEAEWDKVMGINLKGMFLCSQAVAPLMLAGKGGKIINIASSAGQMGGLAVGLDYSTSKAGVFGMTKSLARILAPSIQVNAVSPGTTETSLIEGWDGNALAGIVKQIPLKRLGQPSDVAGAVLFLAAPQTVFITGQTISVNGGLYMP